MFFQLSGATFSDKACELGHTQFKDLGDFLKGHHHENDFEMSKPRRHLFIDRNLKIVYKSY